MTLIFKIKSGKECWEVGREFRLRGKCIDKDGGRGFEGDDEYFIFHGGRTAWGVLGR